ncbi:Leishmanolysin family protein [Leishmania donovani]|uniref:ATP-dependent DNA helicase n=1 Tax=Leishmania donovani TaxID=5661 RepID=A0A504XVI1_LEIDO|nr:Leishmanolysin family protein [Leishmania donovani]
MGPLVSAPGLLASLSVPRPAVLRQRTPAQLMRTAHPEAKYFARGGRQERQPKLHRRRAAVRGGGAAGGSLNTRAAAHAAADAEGAHSVHGVYSNVRGAARHHVTVSGTAATGARDRDAVLLRLSDSDTAQDGLRPGGVTRECTTTAVAAPKAAVSTSTLPPPRVPPTALRTAVSVVVGSGADPRDNSENLQNPRPPQTSSVMLDPTQAKAVDLAVRGFNIFVTGGAGTGKSQTLRAIVAALRSREVHESEETLRAVASAADSPQRGGSGRRAGARESDVAREEGRSVQRGFAEPSPPSRLSELSRATTSASRSSPRSSSAARAVPALSSVCATATTGLAAMQLHGVAINTFAGVGPGRGTPGQPLRTVQKNAEAAQRWRRCRVLLIDEVSMPEASLLEPLDYIAHRVRRCTNVPSGGMQVILPRGAVVLANDLLVSPVMDAAPQAPLALALAVATTPHCPQRPRACRAMSVDSSSTHRHRSVAARLVRLAAAGAAVIAAVGTAAAWAHAGAVQHRCIHDAMQARVRQSVARHHTAPGAVSAVGLSYVTLGAAPTVVRAANWGALRIAVSTEDLTDPAYHCARVGQRISTRDGRFAICTAEDILTDEKRDILVKYLIPQALQLHTERLKVRQVQDKWKVTGMGDDVCSDFKVPPAHITDGLNNTDFVMYVASVPSEEDVLAWATTCQVFSDGHPAVGVVNIPAANIASRYDQLVTRVVTHEMAHALGFSVVFFRDARILRAFRTSTAVAKAREQYGCGTLEYLEMEDQGGAGSAGSHIKMRNAQDELMAPASDAGYYSALTMAIFQDLGFYQADFSKAEEMPWGRNAGCAFLSEKCMEQNITKWPAMFCNSDDALRCPTSRLSLGVCGIAFQRFPMPPYWQYFTDPLLAGISAFMDYCPVVVPYGDGSCAQNTSEADLALKSFSVFSDAARCIDGAFRPKTSYGIIKSYAGLCANVRCDTATRTYSVQVHGGSGYANCTPGLRVELSTVSSAFEEGGYITCPPYVEVCQGNVQAAKDGGNAAAGRRGPRAAATALLVAALLAVAL